MIVSKVRLNYDTVPLGEFIAGKGILKLLQGISNPTNAFVLPPESICCILRIHRSANQLTVNSLTNTVGEQVFEQKVRHKLKILKMCVGTEYYLNQNGEVFCVKPKGSTTVSEFSAFVSEVKVIELLTPVLHICDKKELLLEKLLRFLIVADTNQDIFTRRIGFYLDHTFYQTNPIAIPSVLAAYLIEVIDNKLLEEFVKDPTIAPLVWYHLSYISAEMYVVLAKFAPKLPINLLEEMLC